MRNIVKNGQSQDRPALACASALVSALATGQAASAQATRLSVSGYVSSADGLPLTGLWVASNGGGSGFTPSRRTWTSTPRPSPGVCEDHDLLLT